MLGWKGWFFAWIRIPAADFATTPRLYFLFLIIHIPHSALPPASRVPVLPCSRDGC